MARPKEIRWPFLEKMAFMIDAGATPDEAANKIAGDPVARRVFREWDAAKKEYQRDPIQLGSLARDLKRWWRDHEVDVRRRLEERARTPWSVGAELWQVYRGRPEMEIDADTLRAILAERPLINDSLLDAIAQLLERASAGTDLG